MEASRCLIRGQERRRNTRLGEFRTRDARSLLALGLAEQLLAELETLELAGGGLGEFV
jgi:hypothetical protein